MPDNSKETILLDRDEVYIRKTGGVFVQRIPRRWLRRRDLKRFFMGDLELRLLLENGQFVIEIRRVPKDETG